jgi:hypothetical protein
MEEFNFEEAESNLELANNSVNNVLREYNRKLESLDRKQLDVLQLYFFMKKYDTIKSMTPKGSGYWTEERKNQMINAGLEIVKEIANNVYPGIDDLDELKSLVNNDMNNGLYTFLDDLSNDIKNAYINNSKYVYTMLPISGIEELIASNHRENQYLSSIKDGVFATGTYESVTKYIGSSLTNGMIVRGNEIKYHKNPFSEITDDKAILKQPVSIYLSDANEFEPQFDFTSMDGPPRFIFGGEWIAEKERVKCFEKQTDYIPISFLEENDVYYENENGRVPIKPNNKRL